MSSDIVHFPDSSVMDDEVNRTAMVLDIKLVTHILPFPIDRKRLVMKGVYYHQRNKLLRKMIWTIVI